MRLFCLFGGRSVIRIIGAIDLVSEVDEVCDGNALVPLAMRNGRHVA